MPRRRSRSSRSWRAVSLRVQSAVWNVTAEPGQLSMSIGMSTSGISAFAKENLVLSSIARRLRWPVALLTVYSLAVWTVDWSLGSVIHIPITAHTALGTILGLLLVLRTHTAYDRWWEGRKLWGQLVNDT